MSPQQVEVSGDVTGLTRLRRLGSAPARPSAADRDIAGWQDLLLRIAGTAPDELVRSCRSAAAQHGWLTAAEQLVIALELGRLHLTDSETSLLRREFAIGRRSLPRVFRLPQSGPNSSVGVWRFSQLSTASMPLIAQVAAEPGVLSLWAAVRSSTALWLDPIPIYLVIVEPGYGPLDALLLTARLSEVTESRAMIEVIESGTDDRLDYQRSIRTHGALVWSSVPSPSARSARVFDVVDPTTGPAFDPDHHVNENSRERRRILRYLTEAPVLVATNARMPDILDPSAQVPLSFRSDGEWIWMDSVSYYLERHHLAPDPELLQHISGRSEPPTRLDEAVADQLLNSLLPAPDEWRSA